MHIGHEPWEEERFAKGKLGRQHPWAGGRGTYYDFRAHPELIDQALEDFRPYDKYPAIRRFYEILKWINGPTSQFETSDCMLHPPGPNKTEGQNSLMQIVGRVVLLFRDLRLNISEPSVSWLMAGIHKGLLTKSQNFVDGAICYSRWPHQFITLPNSPIGNVVQLRFWAWGDSLDEVFKNLDCDFELLDAALRYLSAGVETHAPKP